jgi:hypothetical protein
MAAPAAKSSQPAGGNDLKALKDELKQLKADFMAKTKKIRREILLKKAEELK